MTLQKTVRRAMGPGFYGTIKAAARSYLDLQQLRISVEHRQRKLIEEGVVEAYSREEGVPIDKARAKLALAERTERKKLLQGMEGLLEERGILENLVSKVKSSDVYRMLDLHHGRLLAEEKGLLKEARALFEDHPLWAWCEGVRGLGPVACMTFLGYIDPYRCDTAGKLWAYLGLTPGARMKSGVRAHFNPEVKGRILGVVATNVIIQGDPYYTGLKGLKKEYYKARADIVKLGEEKKKGLKGMIEAYSKKWMAKLLTSHVLEIMRLTEGLDVSAIRSHRGYVPPKPLDPGEARRIIESASAGILSGLKS